MSKRILILAPIPFKSGTQLDTYLRVKATALADINNKIDLIAFPYGDDVIISNLNVIRFPKFRMFNAIMPGQYIKVSIYSIFIFLKFLFMKKKNYDAIFLYHTMNLMGWIIKPFIKSKLISTIYSNLETESRKWAISENRLLIQILRKYDLFSNSNYDYLIMGNDIVMKSFMHIKKIKHKIRYIPFAFENSDTPQKGFEKKKYLIILYSGVFHKIQNLDIIIEAARLLKENNIIINLIGATQEERKAYEQKISKYELHNINIHEWIKNEDLISFFLQADVLISTRTEGIDYPMKIFEYLSYGKCILASNRPIHTGVLNDETACLFEPNPEDLAKKITHLESNPEIIREYGKKAKELFEEKYSFERMVSDYRKLLYNI